MMILLIAIVVTIVKACRRLFSFSFHGAHRDLHSFPTRRSSDLTAEQGKPVAEAKGEILYGAAFIEWFAEEDLALDRKSTRLNSSHLGISYAVFCLKKKKHIRFYVHDDSIIIRLRHGAAACIVTN